MSRKSPRTALEIEGEIASIAPGGEGVTHAEIGGERRAVFVPGVAEGERVRALVYATTRPARARLLEVLSPSDKRVPPACTVWSECGACDWMHLSPTEQLRLHSEHVRAALPRELRDVSIEAHPAGRALEYRSRARVHVRVSGGKATVGMHGVRSNDPVIADRCIVLDPILEAARGAFAPLFERAHGEGEVQLALGRFQQVGERRRPVADIRFEGRLPPEFFGRAERLTEGLFQGLRITEGGARAPLVIGDPDAWMTGADGRPLRLGPAGFGQANEEANRALGERIRAVAAEALRGAADAAKVVELFAGAGNWTVLLAGLSHHVTSVEADKTACLAASENLRDRGLAARVHNANADEYTWSSARLLLLDPPRAGAAAVAERLASHPVRHVIYVSCAPPSLGRDLAALREAGYVLRSVETFEMFPQTSHVETMVWLEKDRGGRSR